MLMRLVIVAESPDHEGAYLASESRDRLVAEHGEPPTEFARAWLLDHGEAYSWLTWKHPGDAYSVRKLQAARALWTQIFGRRRRNQ